MQEHGNIFVSAGEASGEHYGALLVAELRKRLQAKGRQASFFGMGGERMESAGLERIVRAEDMAVMGITEVVRHLPRIYTEFRKMKRALAARKPAVAVLIDFPDIHLRLARYLKALGVPVVFFVSPQLWAWKKHRIKDVQRFVDRMLVIFPFEELFYREQGVKADFVGHPLADLPLPTVSREEFAAQNGLDPTAIWIGLLPGSRPKEIRANLPEMLAAARILALRAPGARYEFVLPLAPTLNAEQRAHVAAMIREHGEGIPVQLTADARATLHHARASVVASGTATVEAALIGNPFVVVYRVSPITYAVAKRVVDVPHVAMVNLIAAQRVVPELIQDDFQAAKIVQHLEPLLPEGSPRQSMMKELARVRERLATHTALCAQEAEQQTEGAIGRVAAITLDEMGLGCANGAGGQS